MKRGPRFSIVIPFHGKLEAQKSVERALRSCLRQKAENFEVLLVSNFADEELARSVAALGNTVIRYFSVGKLGVNYARNLGGREARGVYVYFLDADCELPDEFFLQRLEKIIDCHLSYEVWAGGYSTESSGSWRVRGYNALATAWASVGCEDDEKFSPAVNLLGGNFCVRKNVFREGIFFSEEIHWGGEETEFSRRLLAAGKKIGFSANLNVVHRANDGWLRLFSRAWQQGRARGRWALATPLPSASLKNSWRRNFREERALLPFSLLHYSTVCLAAYAPGLSRRVKKMSGNKDQEYSRS